ncbi:MAG: hypothetical protein OEY11_12260 [Gammaproteobacteria bacterium]|nr:hypothetical protein [Gammaproteobacteria bacterium]
MSSSDKTADEGGILFDEQVLLIGGQTVSVKEISFIDGMKVAGLIEPMIDQLADDLLKTSDGGLGLSLLEKVFADYVDTFKALIVMCSNIESAEFIDGLGDEDGQQLLLIFWTVNSRFFISRLQRRSLEKSRAMMEETKAQDKTIQ